MGKMMFEKVACNAVKYASGLMNIGMPDVEFVDSRIFRSTTITSMYLPHINLILFNLDWLSKSKVEEVILTAFHECRHAYQKAQISRDSSVQIRESEETIMKWEKEMNHYYRPKDGYQNDPMYLQQEIELDAVRFSNQLLLKMISEKA